MTGIQTNTIIEPNSSVSLLNKLGLYFWVYVGIFAVFSINIIPRDILIALALIVFFSAPLEITSYIYIFSLPWMYVAKFSFGLTLSLMQSVLFVGKIIWSRKKIKARPYELFYLIFLIACGLMNFINAKSLTGLSFCFYFIISNYYVHEYFAEDEKRDMFWRCSLFSVVVSCFFSAVYGFVNHTSVARWIRGMGYASQLYGAMGTTRFGIYLCIGILFALFYIEKKPIKITVSVLLSLAVISTISMTAIAIMVALYALYFLTKGRMSTKKLSIFLLLLVLIGLSYMFWGRISQISFIRPVALRVEQIVQQVKLGDLSAATSGRTSLSEDYLLKFENASLFQKVFGSFDLSYEGTSYSHNSYIDMLNYFGVFGVFATILFQIRRWLLFKNHQEIKIYFLLKFIIISSAATVSIFSAQYWQIWLYI